MGCDPSPQANLTKSPVVKPENGHTSEMRQCFKKNFPKARTGPKVAETFFTVLEKRGFTSENTLYADSSCPDEINHDDDTEDITGLM